MRTFRSCVCNTFSSPNILEAMLRVTAVRDPDHSVLVIHRKGFVAWYPRWATHLTVEPSNHRT
jgi:hypothetical protein